MFWVKYFFRSPQLGSTPAQCSMINTVIITLDAVFELFGEDLLKIDPVQNSFILRHRIRGYNKK